MPIRLFHIFRNNPLGRETLLQSIYFCKAVGAYPVIYIPTYTKLRLNFEDHAVQIALDPSYLTSPGTAVDHVTQLVEQNGISKKYIIEKPTEPMIHSLRSNFDFMTCPRSISGVSSKISLGHLGARVRRIVKFAPFPILITSPAYKEWNNIAVFFGGSANAVHALKLSFNLGKVTGKPVDVFTQLENEPREFYEKKIEDKNLKKEMNRQVNNWHVYEQGDFEENLYQVPHDALVIMGSHSKGPVKCLMFGSKMEQIQSMLPNNLLIAGPNYREPNTSIPAWFPSLE